jgi:hypothetical protein
MNHFATPDFWFCHRHLPPEVRDLADKNFGLMRDDPRHPSVRLKKIGIFRSARVGCITAHLPASDRRVWSGSGSATTVNTTG